MTVLSHVTVVSSSLCVQSVGHSGKYLAVYAHVLTSRCQAVIAALREGMRFGAGEDRSWKTCSGLCIGTNEL